MILARPSFRRTFAKLSSSQQAQVEAALEKLPQAFGRPHVHLGIGVRPFGGFYEFRAGLGLRVLFLFNRGDFILVTVGDHDAVARFIRDNR